jgi:tripartite-type tricarboxylate transporter receptor subunit TctC
MRMIVTRRSALALVAAPVSGGVAARAEEPYPSRPIRFVVAFPAGSATDLRARMFGERIAADWGQPVVVDNRGGANGFLACQAVARAQPDGYTMLFTANTTHGSNPAMFRRLPYDPVGEFAPVALISQGQILCVVNNDLPVRSMRDLIAYVKANPNKVSFASGSASSRAAGELFKTMAQLDIVNVPYRSNPLGLTDVMAGNIQMMFCDTTTALPQVRAGRVRALGVTSRVRIAVLPDLPTVEEAADLPGYEMLTWNALYAPAGTPREIVGRMNAKVNEILARPDVAERLREEAAIVSPGTPDDLGRFTLAEIEKWRRIVREANMPVE